MRSWPLIRLPADRLDEKGDSRGFAKQIGWSAMSRGMGHMATVNGHLSVEELEQRYVACATPPHRGISRRSGCWRAATRFRARWRAVIEPQGRELDGRGTGPSLGCATARLGGLEGDRLVDPAASEEPEISDAEEAAAFKKSSRTPSPRRQRSNPASQSRSSPRTSAASA